MTTEPTEGHPIKIGLTAINGPLHLMPWVQMLTAYIEPRMGTYSPTSMAAEALNGLIAAGWIPPNDPEEDADPSEADLAAREVADLVWRATTCSKEEAPGIQALTIEALHRYRKRIT